MTKVEFFELPEDKRRDLVADALCNLIILEDMAPSLAWQLFKAGNVEVIKIVLGAYMNGVIN